MPKHPNQKLKLLYLQKLLFERTDEEHRLSMEEILSALSGVDISAERKSIYDDMQALRSFGLDVMQQKGKNGGYYLASREFELAELKLLVDAIQSSRFITHRKSNELIRKVESLASQPQARALQRQVYVTGRTKALNESIYYNIDTLHAAISANKQIRFLYFEWQIDFNGHDHIRKNYRRGGAVYPVSPWALMWDDENYYLVGYDQTAGEVRHYRVDKMERIEITDLPREGRRFFEGFDMASYARKTFGMFSGREQRIRLRCENRFAGVMHDRFGGEMSVSPCDEGHFYAGVNVAVSPQFFAWVFGLGGAVEITEPREVVKEYQALLKKSLKTDM